VPHIKTLGQLYDLPEIVLRFTGWIYHLEPVLRAALGVTKHPLLLDPHGRRKDKIGVPSGFAWIYLRDHDKPFAPLSRTPAIATHMGQGLKGVGGVDPHDLDIAAIQGAKHLHGVIPWSG